MVSDNVTTNTVINFLWVNPIVAAFVGAVIALVGKEFLEWYRRPRFNIDFESREGQKPYIPDYKDESAAGAGIHRVKYLRLIVRNKGKKPAIDCEAKLEIIPDGAIESTNKAALHWSRRDPELYTEYKGWSPVVGQQVSVDTERVFAPINLNIDDAETVDVLRIRFAVSTQPDTDHSPKLMSPLESASLRHLVFSAKTKYQCKVTVYSSNTDPKSFKFTAVWDGTVEGFSRAFTEN